MVSTKSLFSRQSSLLKATDLLFSQTHSHRLYPLFLFSKRGCRFFPVFEHCASPFTANMTTFTILGGPRNLNRSLLTRFVHIFQNKEFGEEFQISLLTMKDLLRWILKAATASSGHVVALLKTKKESGWLQNFAAIFAVIDERFLRKTDTKQIRKILRTSTTMQTYVGYDARVAQWLFTLPRKKTFFAPFLNRSTFFQSVLARTRTIAKTSFPRSNSATVEALFHSSQYWTNKQLPTELPCGSKTALECGGSERSGYSARDESL